MGATIISLQCVASQLCKIPKIISSKLSEVIPSTAFVWPAVSGNHRRFKKMNSRSSNRKNRVFFFTKISQNTPLTVFLSRFIIGRLPKRQLISLFCRVESPGKIGAFMKNVKARRNGGPFQGFARKRVSYNWSHVSVIVPQKSGWLKRRLGPSVNTFRDNFCPLGSFESLQDMDDTENGKREFRLMFVLYSLDGLIYYLLFTLFFILNIYTAYCLICM